MKVRGIAFVGYPVTDVARAREFYEGVLGLEATMDETMPDGKCWVEYGTAEGTLAISNAWPPSDGGGGSGPTVALEVDDLDAVVGELKAKGIGLTFEPMESPVCRMFGVNDPDGNGLILHQRHDDHPDGQVGGSLCE